MKTNELKQYHKNPRKITNKQFKELGNFLEEFGDLSGVVVNMPDKEIIGGNQRTRVFSLEDSQIEITERYDPPTKTGTIAIGFVTYKGERYQYREVSWPKEKAERANLIANKAGGTWDWDVLVNDFDTDVLMSSGFEESDFIGKDFPEKEEKTDADESIPPPQEATSKRGDMYALGDHVLMCGDSANPEDVAKLMGGVLADMVFTDPPYNINYSGRGENTSNTIENDNMDEASFRKNLEAWFKNYHAFTKPESALYCCYASRTHREFEDSLNAANYEVRNQIIWVKKVASMGWGDYRWKHEPIFYCHKKGEALQFYGDRKQYTEWTEEMSDDELLRFIKEHTAKEEVDGTTTVWRMHREQNYDHPTQKPVKLVEIAIKNSSIRGDTVLDLFGGSGSTLISCHLNGRKCRTMEIDPRYVDVIIKRYEKLTGDKAQLLVPHSPTA